jgi:hypothetical protein
MEVSDNAVVLLGAGASAEAGIPTTRKMTNQLVSRIAEESYARDKTVSALHFVCGSLIAYDAAQGLSPFEGLDVERVFAAVELLAERRTLEVTPFVSAWHPAVDAWDEMSRSAPMSLGRDFKKALSSPFDQELVQVITRLIDSRVTANAGGETYAALARRMVGELRRLVAVSPKDVGYLTPLAQRGRRAGGLTVATLNYDLGVEQAAAQAGVPLSTGIGSWLENGRWGWPPNGIRLLKLHGSIDWVWDRHPYEDGELLRDVVRVIDDPEEEHEAPALVFGNRGKLQAKGPFLGLLAEFEDQLTASDQLIVIGYSFRDDHVNEVIRQWTSESKDNDLLVVDPYWPEAYDEAATPFQRELESHLTDWRDPPTFSPRLEVRRTTCSEALSTFPPT